MVKIRRGEAADRRPAEDVWRLSITARDEHAPPAEVATVVHDVLQATTTRLFVAEENSRLVGMACTTPAPNGQGGVIDGVCHIQMVFVLPERMGAGIGGHLLDHVLEDARAGGYGRAQLWVVENNEPAIRLYARRGFTHTGRVVEEGGALIGMWARTLD